MIVAGFAVFAAVGSLLRWQLGNQRWRNWPVGTLLVNVTAAFTLGFLHRSSPDTLTLAGVAFLGSYSTFSTVIREVVDRDGNMRRGLTYLTATVLVGIGAAYLGLQM